MKLFDDRTDFYQYDTNQKLICEECAVGDEIHFQDRFHANAAVCLTYELDGTIVVDVPNAYLLSSGQLIVYRVTRNGDERSTVGQHTFKVIARKRPSDYIYVKPDDGEGSGGSDNDPDVTCTVLLDASGLCLKTADNKYLAVQSV